MTGTQVMVLIIVGIVVAGITISDVVDSWKKVQLAKHGYREGQNGNIHKL